MSSEIKKNMNHPKLRYLLSMGVFILFALLMGGQCFEAQAADGVQEKTLVLRVDGIGCITCEWNIEGNLNKLSGVNDADITSKRVTWWNPFSKKEGKAFITYDANTVTIEQLIGVIEKSSDAIYTYRASVLSE